MGMKAYKVKQKKKEPYWAIMADDQMNKVLKIGVVSLYLYGFYLVAVELWGML